MRNPYRRRSRSYYDRTDDDLVGTASVGFDRARFLFRNPYRSESVGRYVHNFGRVRKFQYAGTACHGSPACVEVYVSTSCGTRGLEA